MQRVRTVLAAADERARDRLAAAEKQAEATLAAAREEAAAIIAAAHAQAAPLGERRTANPDRPELDDDYLYSARLIALPLLAEGKSRAQITAELERQLGPEGLDDAVDYLLGSTPAGTGD
jgi:hypothetical protein